MENLGSYFIFIGGLFGFTIICVLIFVLMSKTEHLHQLQAALYKMKRSFNELDEQAKLIVKTDLELNKSQEESAKRLNALDALQKASRLISTTLDENEIFHRLEQSLITKLGFEKSIVLIYDEVKKLQKKVSWGFSDDDIQFIIGDIEKDSSLTLSLAQGHTFSSVKAPLQRRETINRLFNVEHFVLTPILTKNGIIGLVFVGNRSNAAPITEGDEELVSILANQIGQSLENARLFEEVFRSSQVLESKVQDRTKQLASALEEVQTISKTKTEFISAVSHELRTPLTSIKGYASLLMTGKLGNIPDQVRDRLEKINTHSDNLVKLINDLLDIARIESGRVEMTMRKVQLAHMIENVRDLLTPQIRDKNLQWELEIDPQLPEVELDSSQFERVFINLIGNAIKFTPEKGTITIKAAHDNGWINMEISDTGIGISEEDMDRLFEEFYRVENPINQKVKGTGLGLSLAKKIVEAHNGKIWITSKLNQGTTFHFTIPVKQPGHDEKR
ncbi:MAG: GAF domain-containing sensor histidine kinase [Candidatus Omnitrophota bacterium]|nr:GAF domain-containing sensor histidine kinase [Candidatus Omnitrophota bacterium]